MPAYTLLCEKCKKHSELFCSISKYDKELKSAICPYCSSAKLHRDYQADNIYSTVKEIRTVGQLADYNTKKMGSKLQEIEEQKPKQEKQWYQNPKYGSLTRKEINKLTPEQKKKYVLKGEK
jgi:hypothetical protein